MYGRTRGRFDIIGEVGQAKAVFGFEIDAYWGQTGFSDTTHGRRRCLLHERTAGADHLRCYRSPVPSPRSTSTRTRRAPSRSSGSTSSSRCRWCRSRRSSGSAPSPSPRPPATSWPTYANGDFPGVNLYATFSPTFKLQMTYVAIWTRTCWARALSACRRRHAGTAAEQVHHHARSRGAPPNTRARRSRAVTTGRIIGSPEITVMKGLDIKPMFSHLCITGLTADLTRQGRGGVVINCRWSVRSDHLPSTPTVGPGVGGADGAGTGVHEYRNTVGVDARWRSGPWSVDPIDLYQFGTQAKWNPGRRCRRLRHPGRYQAVGRHQRRGWLTCAPATSSVRYSSSGHDHGDHGSGREEQPVQEHQVLPAAGYGHERTWRTGAPRSCRWVSTTTRSSAPRAAPATPARTIGWDKYGRSALV